MMRWISLIPVSLLFISYSLFAFEGKERIVWDKKPINVMLKVGEERIIHFPASVEHWLPDVVSGVVVAQSVADVFYIRATSQFSTTRFRIREIETNKVYLLDIQATIDAEVPVELVVLEKDQLRDVSVKAAKNKAKIAEDWRVRLTRFAAQQLYAPARVVEADAGIHRIPLEADIRIPLIRGGKIHSKTVASWRGGGWYVHAVKLINQSSERFVIDPRKHYRGHWSTATLQHSWLGPKDSDEAITTVYLTSKRTLSESIAMKEPYHEQKK